MDKELYHFYLPNNQNRVRAGLFTEAPEFSINHVCNGEIDPIYDIENDCIVDKAKIDNVDFTEKINAEIETLDKETTSNISELLAKHIEKKQIENIEIPNEVLLKRKEMISEFHIKKNEIIAKYSV